MYYAEFKNSLLKTKEASYIQYIVFKDRIYIFINHLET